MNTRIFTLTVIFTVLVFGLEAGCIYSKQLEVKELAIGNMLSWSTSKEENSKNFIVEISNDGISFKKLGIVDADKSENDIKEYSFLDIQTGQNKIYYRLVHNEIEGTQMFSRTVLMDRKNENQFMVSSMHSTMVNEIFSCTLRSKEKGDMIYYIMTPNNKIKKEGTMAIQIGENTFDLDLIDLKNGDYTLKMKLDEEIESLNLVKVDASKLPKMDLVIKE